MCYRLYTDTKMYFHCRWSSVNLITILFQNVSYITTCFPSTGMPVHTSIYPAIQTKQQKPSLWMLKKVLHDHTKIQRSIKCPYIKSERNINQLLTENMLCVSLSNDLKQKNFVCIVTVSRGKQIQIKTSSGGMIHIFNYFMTTRKLLFLPIHCIHIQTWQGEAHYITDLDMRCKKLVCCGCFNVCDFIAVCSNYTIVHY